MRFDSPLDRMSLETIDTDFDAGVVAKVPCRIYALIDCHSRQPRSTASKRFPRRAHFLTGAQQREGTRTGPLPDDATRTEAARFHG